MNKQNLFYNLSYVYELVIVSIIFIIFSVLSKNKIFIILAFMSLLFLLFFFRNFLSNVTSNPSLFLSPSSSKVTNIDYEQNIIYTYLSPLDKHFMIAPVDCTVTNIERKKLIESDAERVRVSFMDKFGSAFSLDQIVSKWGYGAWLLSFIYKERCVVFAKVGDTLKQGERYGLIRFGSNMQYNLPHNYQITVKKNQHINIGQPIAII
jgi:phosphatidylserine decarboxylase